MNTYRKNAIIVGILLIVCSAAAIIGGLMAASILNAPDYLAKLAVNQNQAVIAALIEFIWAAAGVGIAIGLYPVIKKYNEGLALGSVVFRVFENMTVIIGTLCLLSLLTLSQQSTIPGVTSDVFVGAREWSHQVIAVIFFLLGALMYYTVLYQSKLIPRWLSGWGFVAAILFLIVTVIGAFNHDFLTSTIHTVLTAPIGLQEMVLAVWLIVKGFSLPRSTKPSIN